LTAARLSRIAVAAIAILFALAGILRLNAFCLLEPDSPGYLFGARSLATFDGYRDIDRKDRPLETLRPPGLSLLLAPVARVAPLHVVPAKTVVLTCAVAMLALLFALARRDAGDLGAGLVLVLVASSPYTLLHATEVVTEVPYILCTIAAMLLMTRRDDAPGRREIALAGALLVAASLLRSVGVALAVAALVWIALDRRRRAWWPAPAASLFVSGAWALRNHLAAGPTYTSSIAALFRQSGAGSLLRSRVEAAGFYASLFSDVLLPGLWPGRPLYERLTIRGTPDLGGLHGLGWAVAAGIVALVVAGLSARRRDGSLIAIYAVLFFAALVIYPPRHERLAWPLVPLAWAAVPAGVAACRRKLPKSAGTAAVSVAIAAGVLLSAWQAAASAAIVRDNTAWREERDAFYEHRIPPLYFADWLAAGRFLREHAPEDAVVLTRHSDVGLTSHLVQEPVRFEDLSPSGWRSRIARAGARYLVVPTSMFGRFFPMEVLPGDPAYTYTRIYEARDVAILEVAPNRSGTISPPPDSRALLEACSSAMTREPGRVDLQVRHAELLVAAGRRDEAIRELAAAAEDPRADVRVVVAFGEDLLDAGRDDEALAAFRRAGRLPEAELLEQRIARGEKAAEESISAHGVDRYVRARVAIARARALMDQLRWVEAYAAIETATRFDDQDPLVLRTLGDWLLHTGRSEEAAVAFGEAGGRGDPGASVIANALRPAVDAEAHAETAGAGAIASAATFFASQGMPGRALALLERTAPRLTGNAEIARRLADLRSFYGLDGGSPAPF